MPKAVADSTGYVRLLSSIRREMARGIVEARRAVERQKVLTYWTIGEHIHAYVARSVAPGGITRFYRHLSRDLKINPRTLQHCEQFYRYFPGLKPRGDLSWSHYRYLLRVEDARERRAWVRRIQAKNLTTDDVRFALSAAGPDPKNAAHGGNLPAPQRGLLYTYRLAPAGELSGEDYPWYVDCGFKNMLEAPPSAAVLHNRYLYTSVKEGEGYRLRVTDAKVEQLFTFKARLMKVVDGDTLHVMLDQGFGLRIRERLRLKGIDAPELSTLAGRRARHWVASRIEGVPFLIVKTYRTDKYDRYLADVFYSRRETDPQQVAAGGAYLNQELLNDGLASLWGGEGRATGTL